MAPPDFFSKLGNTLRTTAGIGVGQIAVKLDTPDVRMGEVICGVVELELAEDTDADKLAVSLVARRKALTVRRAGKRGVVPASEWHTVYELEREIDGKRTYKQGSQSHSFELRVPEQVDEAPPDDIGGVVGDVVRAASALRSATRGPLEWQVIAFLHIPWKRNLKKKVDVAVRRPA